MIRSYHMQFSSANDGLGPESVAHPTSPSDSPKKKYPNNRRVTTSMKFPGASDDGLGDLKKFPLAIRQIVFTYVMDINSKFSDYVKGIAEKWELSAYGPLIKSHYHKTYPNRIRRTKILTISKALSAEALEVMFRTNRFILGPVNFNVKGMRFFPLKEDLAMRQIEEDNQWRKQRCIISLTKIYANHCCRYWEILEQDIKDSIRMLVLDFGLIHTSYRNFAASDDPSRYLTNMLEFAQSCRKLQSLRISISIVNSFDANEQKIISVFRELSKLRGIKQLEIRGSVFHSDLRAPSTVKTIKQPGYYPLTFPWQTRLFLTKEYVDYLNSTSRMMKRKEVQPYKGELFTNKVIESRPEDQEVERERAERYDNWSMTEDQLWELLSSRRAAGWMPWWY